MAFVGSTRIRGVDSRTEGALGLDYLRNLAQEARNGIVVESTGAEGGEGCGASDKTNRKSGRGKGDGNDAE